MTESAVKERLRQQPGRIKTDPAICGGRPHIHRKYIEVIDVMNMLEAGDTSADIVKKYPKITEQDINACRAYQATLIVKTLSKQFAQAGQKPFFMLDENTSYFMLPEVIKMFGPSSHVFAEGLFSENNDDEKHIWAHMVEKGYRAILTMDNDFKRISLTQRHRLAEQHGSLHECPDHVPTVISIPTDNNQDSILRLLEKYQDDIRTLTEQKSVFFAVLTEDGLVIPPYRDFHSHLTPDNCPLLSPS